MRSADLKIQPSATTRQNTTVTKSGKSSDNITARQLCWKLKCSSFQLSTNLPTRFCSWPRSLWSLKWKWGNEYDRSLFMRVVSMRLFHEKSKNSWKAKIIDNKKAKQLKMCEPLVLLLAPFFSLAPLDAPANKLCCTKILSCWQLVLTTCDFALLAFRASTGKAWYIVELKCFPDFKG